MIQKIKKLLMAIVGLLVSINAFAYDFEVDGIYYNFLSETDKTVEITYKGSSYSCVYTGSITIPSSVSYDGTTYSVTSIGNSAFNNCTGLTSVTIPNSVTNICNYAFNHCYNLTELIIEDGLTPLECGYANAGMEQTIEGPYFYVGEGLFCQASLKSVYLGRNLTFPIGEYYGYSPFCGERIKKLTISNTVTSIGNSAFKNCSSLTSITIPNSVTSIGDGAFNGCSGLVEVNIYDLSAWCKIDFGESDSNPLYYAEKLNLNGTEIKDLVIPIDITEIKNYAFAYCGGLTSVTIGNSITSIGNSAFDNCVGLTSVTIGNSVTSIGDYAFRNCTGLTSATIPNSITSIGYGAFAYSSGLTSAIIGNSVTSLGDYAFYNCTSLPSVTIPNSVTSIGKCAFSNCAGLTEINYNAENCTSMGSSSKPVFSGCSNLKTLNIGSEVKSIPSYAFCYCPSLTSASIPNFITSIGYGAFAYCSGLTSVIIGNSVTSLGDYAFYNCTGLPSVTIPNSVTSIGKCAFRNCTGLTSVSIPNSVTSIGYAVFYECRGLTEVTIPNSVVSIDDFAFGKCTGLTSVTIPNSVTSIGYAVFNDCCGLTELTIPNSVTSIGGNAFEDCTGLTSLIMSNSVAEIGDSAFYGCNALVSQSVLSTTQTAVTVDLSSNTKYSPYLYVNNKYYNNNEKIKGLIPGRSYDYEYGLELNKIYCIIGSSTFETLPFDVYLSAKVNPTSIIATGAYSDGDATIEGMGFGLNEEVSVLDNSNSLVFYNLDPNTSYNVNWGVKIKENAEVYSTSETFITGDLELTSQEAKATSSSSVRLIATTNCDATTGTGFEWRRYDAPAELPSSKVSCPVVDGLLIGSLRGVKDDAYYKYRPFYTSASGKTYYGEWIAFFTGDANVYFEPEVQTYSDYAITDNSVVVKGYALEGTDEITAQGFEYWKTGSTILPSSTENHMTVMTSGIKMSATLANLEYSSTYKYRAFVTTAKGTVYGKEVEFSTGEDPTGVENIVIDNALSEIEEIARFDIHGRRLSKPSRGVNIVIYSDGTTRKEIIK